MSFKALNDIKRHRALIPSLEIADTIEGCLINVAVSKNGESLFEAITSKDAKLLTLWKPRVREQLLRVVHLSALLVSWLSRPGQHVMFLIDKDSIAANEKQLTQLTKIFGNISSHYLEHGLGHLRVGTSQSENGDMALEDLLAIPDLAAGAVAEIGREFLGQDLYPRPKLTTPLPEQLTAKARLIAMWLSAVDFPLRRESFFLDLDEGGRGSQLTHVKFHAFDRPNSIIV